MIYSFFIGLPVGWVYARSGKRAIELFSKNLINPSDQNLRPQAAKTLFIAQTLTKIMLFMTVTVASVLIIKLDPFMFCIGVLLSLVVFVATNFWTQV